MPTEIVGLKKGKYTKKRRKTKNPLSVCVCACFFSLFVIHARVCVCFLSFCVSGRWGDTFGEHTKVGAFLFSWLVLGGGRLAVSVFCTCACVCVSWAEPIAVRCGLVLFLCTNLLLLLFFRSRVGLEARAIDPRAISMIRCPSTHMHPQP
jgi:hypothetical protein